MSRSSCLAMVAGVAAFAGTPMAWAQPAPASPAQAAAASRPAPAAGQGAPRPPPRPATKPPARPTPSATIGRANAQARDWPTAGAYVNSAIFYDYEPGRIYTITASPRFLTTIALRPGEKLISKAAGDTVRWVMGETVAGSPAGEQVIIFVKPIRPDLRTNIVLTTDQRTYLIDATSAPGSAYTSVLSWNYPLDEARALAARASAEAARTSLSAPIEALDFSYRVATVKGRTPRWSPVRVFDDGAKTFIAFPAGFSTMEAPPLFLLGEDGRAELVNYRVQGGYYVVDRLIERAELRLGEKPQTIVRITRLGPRA